MKFRRYSHERVSKKKIDKSGLKLSSLLCFPRNKRLSNSPIVMACPYSGKVAPKDTSARCPATGASSSSPPRTCPHQPKTMKKTPTKFVVSEENKEILKATIPAVAAAGVSFTKHFYNRMFTAVPCLKNTFNSTNQAVGKQPSRLFATVAEAALSCVQDREFDELMAENIVHKHCALHVQGGQYAVVGEHLLGTISECLTTDEKVLGAWGELYGLLAQKLKDMEEALYQETESKEGGWRGMREFRLAEKTPVAEDIVRFRFVPVDGGKVCSFRNGQYITVWAQPEGWKYRQPRHYTLYTEGEMKEGAASTQGYSISIRKQGAMSEFLHSAEVGTVVQLTAPFGGFDLRGLDELWAKDASVPVVLLSAGVGVTPLLSLLEGMVERKEGEGRKVMWLHGSRNAGRHPYRERVTEIAKENAWLTRRVWYSGVEEVEEGEEEENLRKHHFVGRMDLKDVEGMIPFTDTRVQFYLCGPSGWMETMLETLEKGYGVGTERLLYESF